MRRRCVPDTLLLLALVCLGWLLCCTDVVEGQPLVLRDCAPGTVVSGEVVSGERFGIIAINCPGIVIEDNHVEFHGLDPDGSSRPGGGGIVLYESPGGVVRNNVVGSYGGARTGVGIRVHRSSGSEVYMNRLDLRGDTNVYDGECIAVNSSDTLVWGNTLRGCPGIGILLWGGVNNGTHNVRVLDNVVIDPGYGLKWGNGAWRNWAYPAVSVLSKDSLVTGAVIEGNLLVDTPDPKSRKAWTPVKVSGGCGGCTIAGNERSQ